jgi:acetolactate synthase I/II/III large subunit
MAKRNPTFESTAEAYLSLLKSRGIDWLFANAGTDFAPIIEALVRGRKAGIAMPEAVAIAHETTAVAMAHGYYLVTGKPQAVMVHVNVGTANALMGLINASRDQVPMLFTSGRTPLTEQGMLGSRDLPIHWGQEMFDQGSMLREFVKWDYELRTPVQLEAAVDRALSLAMSEPKGPVYLSLPREVLAEPWSGQSVAAATTLKPASDPHPDPAAIAAAAAILREAERPLIIVGGGDQSAFGAVSPFAEQAAIPVIQFWPRRLALATTDPMHAGFDVTTHIETADAIVVLDVMVPWLPVKHTLAKGCRVIQIGPDPSFSRTPMRSFQGDVVIRSSVAAALHSLSDAVGDAPAKRKKAVQAARDTERKRQAESAAIPASGLCTNAFVSRCLDLHKGDDAIVFNELGCDPSVMTFKHRDSYFGHPIAGGLGWGVPAALGAKLALPDRLVIACVGDGSYMFANPVACHQTAAALNLPIFTIVFNNAVWNAVRKSTRAVYPKGHAAASNDMPLSSLSPSPAYEKVIEASGGLGIAVTNPAELDGALQQAIAAVRGGRQALLNVHCEIGS